MTDRRWKHTEREVAKRLGGERVPITGRQRGSAPDILHDWLALEVKDRKKFPVWLYDAVDQAVSCSKSLEKLPMVVLHEAGRAHGNDLVVLRLSDWCDWFGDLVEPRPLDGGSDRVENS